MSGIEVGQCADGSRAYAGQLGDAHEITAFGSGSGKSRLIGRVASVLAVSTDGVYAFDAKDTDEDLRADWPAPRRTVRACQPRPMTNNTPVPTGTLPEIAAEIVTQLRVAGFDSEGAVDRNVLCLAEEAGEVVGAYRRYTGQARRTGTVADVAAELADVVITSYVTAHEIGMDLDAHAWATVAPSAVHFLTAERWVRELYVRAGRFVEHFVDRCAATSPGVELDLANVVAGAYAVALTLGINLDAAIAEKLVVVFSRGWRDGGRGDA